MEHTDTTPEGHVIVAMWEPYADYGMVFHSADEARAMEPTSTPTIVMICRACHVLAGSGHIAVADLD